MIDNYAETLGMLERAWWVANDRVQVSKGNLDSVGTDFLAIRNNISQVILELWSQGKEIEQFWAIEEEYLSKDEEYEDECHLIIKNHKDWKTLGR